MSEKHLLLITHHSSLITRHMRLAYFSPLPPSKSGIADYSAELLPHLARSAEVAVFVEQAAELRANRDRVDYAVYDVAHFDEIHAQEPFDLCLYHHGNNPHHEYIYERALKTPGISVLHEHCLHHLLAWKLLGRDDEEGYWDELFFAYGRRGAQIAEMRERDISSEYQQFVMPLNRRLIEASLGIIVHNAYAASQLEGVSESSRSMIEIIPHHLSPKVYELDGWDAAACREMLGLPAEAWLVASFGFVTQSKRLPMLLRAFKQLLNALPQAMCLIVGEDHWKWSIAPLIEEMEMQDHVRLTGYTSEPKFFRYLKAVDAVVNLRYPTAGETSGTLIRALGAGKPVIVSDFGQFAELPDEICLKTPLGQNAEDEEHALYQQLRKLAYRPGLRARLSQAASAWVRKHCDIQRSAASYLAFAERVINECAQPQRLHEIKIAQTYQLDEIKTIALDKAEALDYVRGFFTDNPAATTYLGQHAERVIETVKLVPMGSAQHRVLELSSYLQMTPLLKRYGQYGEIAITNWWEGEPPVKTKSIRHSITGEEYSFQMPNVDVERGRFPYQDEYFDTALCCELIEHLTEDPMHMLIELHRVLKWGGALILTTPNIASAFSIYELMVGSSPYIYGSYNLESRADRHSREFTPKDVRLMLESAGFKVTRLFTKDVWHTTNEDFLRRLDHTGVPRDLRGDNIFAVGRKMSAQIVRYPDRLYD